MWAAPTKTPFLFANFFFAAPSCKEKVAMDVEKPRGYSRLASANSLPAFSFDERGAQEILAICLQIGGVQPPQNLHLLALASWKD